MIDIIFETNDNKHKELLIKKVEGRELYKFRVGIYDYETDQEQYIVLTKDQVEALADACMSNL